MTKPTAETSEINAGLPDAEPMPSPRDRLLDTAARLFYGRGINATGIDLILAESGVAKGTLYHHFDGKQGLLLAYLARERANWESGALAADDPGAGAADRLNRMFESVVDAVRAGTFHGCPFTNAVIERPHDVDVRASVDDYSERLRRHIAEILGAESSSLKVQQIFVIYNGALTTVKLTRDVKYLRRSSDLAQRLV